MTYNNRYRRKHRISDMNVVPYIDVMLVLLIIFMITSPLLTEGVQVDLPRAEVGAKPIAAPQGELILVTVDGDNALFLQDSLIPIERAVLFQKIALMIENQPNAQVFIKADKNLAYGAVIDIMDSLKGIGIEKVSLITQSHLNLTESN